MRKGATVGCMAVMLGCSVGSALAATTVARDPGNQMLVTRDFDNTLVIDTSDRDDDIEISRNRNGSVRVTVNGSARDFAAEDAESIAIRANGGNDQIRVRPGTNMRGIQLRIEGGAGNDRIIGGDGHEVLVGGEGDDEIDGGKGNDLILGGGGNDHLRGGEGRDILIGGSGDDHLDGGPGADFLQAGGNDGDEVVAGKGDVKIGPATSNAGHTIVVRGTSEFIDATNDALDVLRSTPTGRALLETIDRSGHRVVIEEVPEQNATAVHIDSAPQFLRRNGRRGAGTDVTITWNPKFAGIPDDAPWMYTPPAIILGHELVHAFNMVTGTMPADGGQRFGGPHFPRRDHDQPPGPPPAAEELAVGLRFDHDGNPRTKKISVADFYRRHGLPVVSENALRRELGWPIRQRY